MSITTKRKRGETMNCQKCSGKLMYGTKYCNECGEAVPKESFEEPYKQSIWGKLDRLKDVYDTLFFKKITGSIVFKILVLVAVILVGVYSAYIKTNQITLEKSANYGLKYNTNKDEYYIKPYEDEILLGLGIPDSADKVVMEIFSDGKASEKREFLPNEYSNEDLVVKKGEADYLTIETRKNKKTSDKIMLVIEK